MAEQIKYCEVCKKAFEPDPRVGDRQRVCRSLSCQQERKRRSQASWLSRNPDAFKGRYCIIKDWLAAHPGYLRTWRQNRRSRHRPDIQDELTCLKTISASELGDIQDKLTSCFTRYLSGPDDSLKTDIQDELRLVLPILYLATIYKTRLRL